MTEDTPTPKPPDEPKTFAEYAMVRLIRPVHGFGVLYPVGSVGVIVHRHDDGIGYEVEFDSPKHGVATALGRDLVAADDVSR